VTAVHPGARLSPRGAPGARPRALDVFSGAGGASEGYHRAGFDVVGVDLCRTFRKDGTWKTNNAIRRRYPFQLIQADALEFLASADLSAFDLIHASPVCKRWSSATPSHARDSHPDQIAPVRELLERSGRPYVIENVPGAPLRPDLKICGCVVGLDELERERWFELGGWSAPLLRQPCYHRTSPITVAGHGEPSGPRMAHGLIAHKADWERAMGIGWMDRDSLAQAIPPAYTEMIGRLFLEHLGSVAA
jgi:DNA (cytosine-5)-methyltransferase 1